MNEEEKAAYIEGARAEVRRVEKLCPNFKHLDYIRLSMPPYNVQQIKDNCGMTVNDIKVLEGMAVKAQNGGRGQK